MANMGTNQVSGSQADDSALAWEANEIHIAQGNLGLSDGSVQQFTSSSLREHLRNTGSARNLYAQPGHKDAAVKVTERPND